MKNFFYIYFFGLICHIGPANDRKKKTHATIVHTAEPHQPKFVTSRDDPGTPITANLDFGNGHGQASTTPEFEAFVTRLTDILGDVDAKQSVKEKTNHEAFHLSYPHLSNDDRIELSVAHLYDNYGDYRVNDALVDTRVVAQVVVATIETSATELILRHDGVAAHTMRANNPCLLITNVELPNRSSVNDFAHYTRLLETSTTATVADGRNHRIKVDTPKNDCDWFFKHIQTARDLQVKAAFSTECGNTQWP